MEHKKQRQTKIKIKKALLACMADKKFDLITVNDIVQKAAINRSTFYRYYDDKYSLLDEIETTVIKRIDLFKAKDPVYIEGKGYINSQNIVALLKYLKKYNFVINKLLSTNGDPLFEIRLRNQLSDQFYKSIDVKESNDKIILIKDFLGNIVVEIFRKWTSKNTNISEDELSQIIEDLLTGGFIQAINHSKKA